MADRQRHTDKDIETLLKEAEGRGWRIDRRKGYFKCYCPCAEKEFVSVALTPSGHRFLANKRAEFRRKGCWEDA